MRTALDASLGHDSHPKEEEETNKEEEEERCELPAALNNVVANKRDRAWTEGMMAFMETAEKVTTVIITIINIIIDLIQAEERSLKREAKKPKRSSTISSSQRSKYDAVPNANVGDEAHLGCLQVSRIALGRSSLEPQGQRCQRL